MPPRPFSGLSGRTSDPGRSRGILQTRPKPQKASASFLRLVVFIASEALPADKLPLAAVDDDPFRSFKKTILSSRLAQTPRRSVHRKHAGRRSTDRRHHARASLQTVRRALNIDMHQFNRAVMPAQEHISSAKLFTNTFFFSFIFMLFLVSIPNASWRWRRSFGPLPAFACMHSGNQSDEALCCLRVLHLRKA